jgi:hypothetical protein
MQFKETLDKQIAGKSPDFAKYLDAYKQGSQPISRMQVGQSLYKSGSGPVIDPVTGDYTLTPGGFGRQVRNLDAAAAKATGFSKAKASDILQPRDMQAIGNIQDDLTRQAFADSAGRGSGSDTFQKFMAQGNALAAMQAIGVSVPGAGVLKLLGNKGVERVNARLAQVLANPEQARAILATTPAAERRIIEQMLSQLGGRAGAIGASHMQTGATP